MSDMFECYNIRIMAAYVRGMLSRNGQLLNVPLDRLREDECEVRLEAGRAAGTIWNRIVPWRGSDGYHRLWRTSSYENLLKLRGVFPFSS